MIARSRTRSARVNVLPGLSRIFCASAADCRQRASSGAGLDSPPAAIHVAARARIATETAAGMYGRRSRGAPSRAAGGRAGDVSLAGMGKPSQNCDGSRHREYTYGWFNLQWESRLGINSELIPRQRARQNRQAKSARIPRRDVKIVPHGTEPPPLKWGGGQILRAREEGLRAVYGLNRLENFTPPPSPLKMRVSHIENELSTIKLRATQTPLDAPGSRVPIAECSVLCTAQPATSANAGLLRRFPLHNRRAA